MVRARGGHSRGGGNNTPTTGRKKLPKNNEKLSQRKPIRRPRGRGRKNQKFSEFARNFSQYNSDSDDSVGSLESANSSIGLSVDLSFDDPKLSNSPKFDYEEKRSRSITPEPEPIVSAPLLLPPSSGDLLIPSNIIMKTLQVYEVVRHFGRVLRISPIGFEDFCAAIISDEQPCILAELHINMLKPLLAEDEANNISYGNTEEKDMVNIHLYILDSYTWPEIVRTYINADPNLAHLVHIVEKPKYPYVPAEDKLDILSQLTDNILALNFIREEIANEGLFISDDHCRKCGRMGDLLCCELCPSVYHLECLSPPLLKVPDDEWICPVCSEQSIKGVTDVLSELDGLQVYRNEPLGVDRHRRTYWFMVRRIIVDGEEDIFYYSCQKHLDELIDVLKDEEDESELVAVLEERYDDIVRHMKVTAELYEENRGELLSYLEYPREKGKLVDSKDFELHKSILEKEKAEEKIKAEAKEKKSIEDKADIMEIDQGFPMITFVHDNDVASFIIDKKSNEREQMSNHMDVDGKQDPVKKVVGEVLNMCVSHVMWSNGEEYETTNGDGSRNGSSDTCDVLAAQIAKEYEQFQEEIRNKNTLEAASEMDEKVVGTMLHTHVDGDVTMDNVVGAINETSIANVVELQNENKSEQQLLNLKLYFKLGEGSTYATYANQYTTNFLAKGKKEFQSEKDKRKILFKFSTNDIKWTGWSYKGLPEAIAALKTSLIAFKSSIPSAFLHPFWYKHESVWMKATRLCKEVNEFAALILFLQEMIKPVVLCGVWKEACGMLKLKRVYIDPNVKTKGRPKKIDTQQRDLQQQKDPTEVMGINLDMNDDAESGSEDEEVKVMPLKPVRFSWVPKHTIWEQKGEEYRLTGVGAWYWSCGCRKKYRRILTRETKKTLIEKVLKSMKLKKGTQFVKKDKLNVIESLPSEYDKRDEQIELEMGEELLSPRLLVPRSHWKKEKIEEDDFKYPLKFCLKANCNADETPIWCEDTEMEILDHEVDNIVDIESTDPKMEVDTPMTIANFMVKSLNNALSVAPIVISLSTPTPFCSSVKIAPINQVTFTTTAINTIPSVGLPINSLNKDSLLLGPQQQQQQQPILIVPSNTLLNSISPTVQRNLTTCSVLSKHTLSSPLMTNVIPQPAPIINDVSMSDMPKLGLVSTFPASLVNAVKSSLVGFPSIAPASAVSTGNLKLLQTVSSSAEAKQLQTTETKPVENKSFTQIIEKPQQKQILIRQTLKIGLLPNENVVDLLVAAEKINPISEQTSQLPTTAEVERQKITEVQNQIDLKVSEASVGEKSTTICKAGLLVSTKKVCEPSKLTSDEIPADGLFEEDNVSLAKENGKAKTDMVASEKTSAVDGNLENVPIVNQDHKMAIEENSVIEQDEERNDESLELISVPLHISDQKEKNMIADEGQIEKNSEIMNEQVPPSEQIMDSGEEEVVTKLNEKAVTQTEKEKVIIPNENTKVPADQKAPIIEQDEKPAIISQEDNFLDLLVNQALGINPTPMEVDNDITTNAQNVMLPVVVQDKTEPNDTIISGLSNEIPSIVGQEEIISVNSQELLDHTDFQIDNGLTDVQNEISLSTNPAEITTQLPLEKQQLLQQQIQQEKELLHQQKKQLLLEQQEKEMQVQKQRKLEEQQVKELQHQLLQQQQQKQQQLLQQQLQQQQQQLLQQQQQEKQQLLQQQLQQQQQQLLHQQQQEKQQLLQQQQQQLLQQQIQIQLLQQQQQQQQEQQKQQKQIKQQIQKQQLQQLQQQLQQQQQLKLQQQLLGNSSATVTSISNRLSTSGTSPITKIIASDKFISALKVASSSEINQDLSGSFLAPVASFQGRTISINNTLSGAVSGIITQAGTTLPASNITSNKTTLLVNPNSVQGFSQLLQTSSNILTSQQIPILTTVANLPTLTTLSNATNLTMSPSSISQLSNLTNSIFSQSGNVATGKMDVPRKLPLPRLISKTQPSNLNSLVVNGSNNLALMQALAAAGIKTNEGIVTLKTSTGHFIIKTSNPSSFSNSLEQGDVKLNFMSPTTLPSGLVDIKVKPEKITPNILTMKKMPTSITPGKLKSQSLVSMVNKINQPSIPVQIQNPKTETPPPPPQRNRAVNYHRKTESKLDFSTIVENKVRCLYSVCGKPEQLLKHETERLKRYRNNSRSIFMLRKHMVSRVARKGGLEDVEGFLYHNKIANAWPDNIPRPNFERAWRHRVMKANNYATLGHLLRMLHCCMKWEEINSKPPKGVNRAITSNKGVITVEILDGEPVYSDGRVYRYKVRKNYQPFKIYAKKNKPDKDKLQNSKPDPASTTPKSRGSASGIKLRERVAPMKYTLDDDYSSSSSEDDSGEMFPKERVSLESWMHESELDLWEIRQFWELVESERINKVQQELLQKQIAANNSSQYKKTIISTPDTDGRNSKTIISKVPLLPKPAMNFMSDKTNSPVNMASTPTRLIINNSYQRPVSVHGQLKSIKSVAFPAMKGMTDAIFKKYSTIGRGVSSTVALSQAVLPSASIISESQNTKVSRNSSKKEEKIFTDPNFFIAKNIVDMLVRKIEIHERKERRKIEKLAATLKKQQDQEMTRLNGLLTERKDRLKIEILRKRELIEEVMLREVHMDIEEELGLSNPRAYDDTNQTQNHHQPRKMPEEVLPIVPEVFDDHLIPDVGHEVVHPHRTKKLPKPEPKSYSERKLYCICKTSYDDTKFYVGCDLCNDWFHGTCIGITEEMASDIDEYICGECKVQKETVEEQELYCLCQEPYDDSKFYIGCDFCQDWFHGKCVGITQVEASTIEEYKCPNCCKKNDQNLIELKVLTGKELDGLKRLHRALQGHKMAWPFVKPVDPVEFKDYYEQITEPMDLETMSKKLRHKKYLTLTDFVADVSRIFDNCRYYNPADSAYYRCAEVLENFFVQKLKGFKNTLKMKS